MKIQITSSGIFLIREDGDKKLYKETSVTFHMRRLLNERDGGGWRRFNPSRYGLTSCTSGVRNITRDTWYWHGSYAIEAAHETYNDGTVFFDKA